MKRLFFAFVFLFLLSGLGAASAQETVVSIDISQQGPPISKYL